MLSYFSWCLLGSLSSLSSRTQVNIHHERFKNADEEEALAKTSTMACEDTWRENMWNWEDTKEVIPIQETGRSKNAENHKRKKIKR